MSKKKNCHQEACDELVESLEEIDEELDKVDNNNNKIIIIITIISVYLTKSDKQK